MIPARIAALAADRVSGASAILGRAIDILRSALAGDVDLTETARALVRAQPSMAPVWNAALAALAGRDRFEAFAARVQRAPAALTRTALDVFSDPPRHIVTLSYSGSVLAVLEEFSRVRPLQVSCSEGRPAMEGRALATRLARPGIAVTLTTDAALGEALTSADVVLVGADAVTAGWFLNKVGTRMLAATAAADRVPVYVAATQDKFASPAVAARLSVRERATAEVWSDPPPRVGVRNVYFERTPLEAVTAVISDVGILGTERVREVCNALEEEFPAKMVRLLDA